MTYRNKRESRKAIDLSGRRCVICGWKKCDYKGNLLLVGAHVRGFRNTSDYDRHDNIISLCPNHHAEFDAGNITIDPKTQICSHVDSTDPFHRKRIVGKISHVQIGYFDYHQKNTFKQKPLG